jgi:hypothetical protein
VTRTGMLDLLDDRINPIVVKELRQAVKSRLVMAALLLLLLLQVVILGCFLLWGQIRHGESVDYQAGRTIFLTLQGIMMGTCMLLIPAYAGVRLAAERSDTNVDLLFISTLKPRAIVWGKFLAAVVLVLLIFSACAPFMTFTYLLRGIDIPSILLVLGIDLLAVLLATMMAIFFAAVPTNLALKIVLLLIAFVALIFQLWSAIAASVGILELGPRLRLDMPEFWAAFAVSVTGILALMGLLFVWSVAVVSPPSANRALRVRLYNLAVWTVTAVAAWWGTSVIKHPGFLYTWQGLMLFLFCLQLVISINERDHWGPRVLRAIPRNGLLRFVAFLTYSGAAGGLLYGVLMLALTIGLGTAAVFWWKDRYPYPVRTELGLVAKVMTVICLYVYAYALTAVLCRRTFFSSMLKPVFTWVLMLVLAALGSALPYLIILVVPQNSLQFEMDNTWILLPNPIASVVAVADPRHNTNIHDFDGVCLLFVSLWSVLVTLLALPWFAAQVRAFRPLSRPVADSDQVLWARPVPAVPNGEASPRVLPEAVTPPAPVQEAPAGEPGA